jgi:hypothetical protein
MTTIFMCLVESKSLILAISLNMFAQVRQNPEFAEPQTKPGASSGLVQVWHWFKIEHQQH